jgi:hypothetical protein
MCALQVYDGPLPEPISILESLLTAAGSSLIKATFDYCFFVSPEAVRAKCPYFPERARLSREHYSGSLSGQSADWNGRTVVLGDNRRAQRAWAAYTKRAVARSSGYGVRHIWGHPWDPDAFTAGWNLCYMPFWLGMLTEEQHPHPFVQKLIQQVSFDLFFKSGCVSTVPSYVSDPGLDLERFLDGHKIQILGKSAAKRIPQPIDADVSPLEKVKMIRRQRSQSWANLLKAANDLRGLPHAPFGTANVKSNSRSVVRLILRETGLELDALAQMLEALQQDD